MAAVTTNVDARDVAGALASLRRSPPMVHCLVGADVAPLTAAVLVSAGAQHPDAGPGTAVGADAVLVGLGTMGDAAAAAALTVARSAHEQGVQWVLDPDTASGSSSLARAAVELLRWYPTTVRGTAAEMISLSGAGGRVEGPQSIARAFHLGNELARRTGGVVAMSGEVDLVTDGERCLRVEGGELLLARVAGVGTALAALVAAYTAVVEDALLAAVAAHVHVAVAAEVAATASGDVAGFTAAWVEALRSVDPGAMADGARLV